MSETSNREVIAVSGGVPSSDGAGVRLMRLIGRPGFDQLDPFLLFDVFHSDRAEDYIAGFPPHPHRGFETVTYMFAGRMKHEDNAGHAGIIETGGVQWMTAGRGIIHSEMPEQESGLMWGCQLWVNLPGADKMTEPRYQEYAADRIPPERRETEGAQLKIIAGTSSNGTVGIVRDVAVEPLYFDIALQAGGRFREPLPASHSAFLFVVEGAVRVIADNEASSRNVPTGKIAVLGEGRQVKVAGENDSRFLLIAGRRLNEPVARGGPFVMNTREQVMQAFEDYQAGRF